MVATTIDRVCEYLQEMFSCSSQGGRICKLTDKACIISDVPSWTDEMSACLREKFSGVVSVEVHGSSESLTGFNVIVRIDDKPYTKIMPMLLFLAITSIASSVWFKIID